MALKLSDTCPMPTGKHKGKRMVGVPASYLIWLHGAIAKQQHKDGNSLAIYNYVEDNLDVLKKKLNT